MGTRERPINNSKGCGGLMRVAPAGLFFEGPETAFEMAVRIAAITHGHPSGYLAAGAFATMINLLLSGHTLESSIDNATAILRRNRKHEECLRALEEARVAAEGVEPSPESVERLGAGWVAEEALAIAVYSALVSKGNFTRGVLLAVNHSGDSDSTGSIVGSLLGTTVGADALPAQWVERLELREAIDQMAMDLYVKYEESSEWPSKYPI
jgi:ADP-ribosylglycohydrolase